jgi:serine protease AprX
MRQNPNVPHLRKFVISPHVKREIDAQAQEPAPRPIPVIISLQDAKVDAASGIQVARVKVIDFLKAKNIAFRQTDFYVFASLTPKDIQELSQMTDSVHRIWKDETCYAHLLSSVDTIKATACWRTFSGRGQGITWAVMDTGIRADHPHFNFYPKQPTVDSTLSQNFSFSGGPKDINDLNGHGTHVAGIIAGASPPREGQPYRAATFLEDPQSAQVSCLAACPSGVAPLATLINVKVLNDDGTGSASCAIQGLEYLRKLNQGSRSIRVDGVNMSLGYPFDPQSYGCGHSPLCDEVNRAVDSGLIVVISCGNWGYGTNKLDTGQEVPVYVGTSITDPANADQAIAVGSVHKTAPHHYGVSYFSSKGPTGDGRMKPDLVAPGEKVISCSIHLEKGYEYEEASGTSTAAPHVSGAIAAFLSMHEEFRGDPEPVKQIFLKSARDLGRDRTFQGAGLIDLLGAMMSV